jgi:hypothetical protein
MNLQFAYRGAPEGERVVIKGDVVRVEVPMVSSREEQLKVILLDAEDSFDVIIEYHTGEREAVWSLVKDGEQAGQIRHGDYLHEDSSPAFDPNDPRLTDLDTVYNLCGADNCWVISPDDDWHFYNKDDYGNRQLVPQDSEPAIAACPNCGYEHTDDDADPGVWSGHYIDMLVERENNQPEEPDDA